MSDWQYRLSISVIVVGVIALVGLIAYQGYEDNVSYNASACNAIGGCHGR